MNLVILSAFMAAFFAFLFIKLGLIYERKNKSYNSLVELEYNINFIISQIEENGFAISFFKEVLDKSNKENESPIAFLKLQKIPFDKTILSNLANIDLINDLISYFIEIEKTNQDVETLNYFYQEIRNSKVEKKITAEEYNLNVKYFIAQLDIFIKFLVDLKEQTIINLAIIRILMREKPFITRIILFTLNKSYQKSLSNNLSDEVKKIKKEITDVKTASSRKIKKILNDE